MTAARRLSQDQEFHRFASEHLPTLLKGAYLLLHDVDLAEDAVQGTLLRVFRRWNEARHSPETYSQKALLSVCRDYWRRQRRRPDEVLSGTAPAADVDLGLSDQVVERAALNQALSELPDLQREVLVLRFFFDLSISDTATVLELPEGTVKSSAHRGLRHLHGLLRAPDQEVKAK